MEVLFARNNRQDIVYWSIDLNVDNKFPQIIIEHGIFGKKGIIHVDEIKEGKNIGKSNYRTPFAQANSEIKSRIHHKRREGYKSVEDLGIANTGDKFQLLNLLQQILPPYNLDLDNTLKPMKAQKFEPGCMKYPALAQPKYNGIRAVMRLEKVENGLFPEEKITIRSKEGLIYDKVDHIITKDLFNLFKEYDNLIIDGELYIHGEYLQNIRSAAMNKSNPLNSLVNFITFDLGSEESQMERMEKLCFLNLKEVSPSIVTSTYSFINTDNEAIDYMETCIKHGFEGAILRDLSATYQFGKRPMTMRKLKKFSDAEFEVIDIIEADKNPGVAVFVLKNDINEEIFKSNPIGTTDQRKEYLTNKSKYIGTKATVKFYERTADGIPFHSNVITIRNYE